MVMVPARWITSYVFVSASLEWSILGRGLFLLLIQLPLWMPVRWSSPRVNLQRKTSKSYSTKRKKCHRMRGQPNHNQQGITQEQLRLPGWREGSSKQGLKGKAGPIPAYEMLLNWDGDKTASRANKPW
jgi:hypothetical protein